MFLRVNLIYAYLSEFLLVLLQSIYLRMAKSLQVPRHCYTVKVEVKVKGVNNEMVKVEVKVKAVNNEMVKGKVTCVVNKTVKKKVGEAINASGKSRS